jgi:recombination protein RecT
MSNGPSRAIVSSKEKQATLKDLFEKAKPSIAAVLPKHVTADRLLKVALSATSRTPELLACTPQSMLLAVMQSAELGLEVGGLLGDAYFVKFKDTCQLIIGYRGMIKLARQSGDLKSLEAHVVRDNDVFELEFGLDTKLIHKPAMAGELGKVVAAYAVARFKDGGHQVDVMTLAEIEAIRTRSKSGESGPWATDYAEMAKKTVVRRLCKYLPLSPELQKALEHEAAVEQNVASPVIDIEVLQTEPQTAPSRADAVREHLAGRQPNGVANGAVYDTTIVDAEVTT